MPIPKRVARFNKRVTNRITRHIAGWMPGFAIVTHVGRRSGRTYRTPVNVKGEVLGWPSSLNCDGFLFALMYGADSDWVRNVIAAGGCRIETRRRTYELREPQRFTDPTRAGVPVPVRWIMRRLDVEDFMTLRKA